MAELSIDVGESWGVILIDDQPIAIAHYVHERFRIQHVAGSKDRELPLSGDVYDKLATIEAINRIVLLEQVKAILDESEYGEDCGPLVIVT